jgi:hypothetical protein
MEASTKTAFWDMAPCSVVDPTPMRPHGATSQKAVCHLRSFPGSQEREINPDHILPSVLVLSIHLGLQNGSSLQGFRTSHLRHERHMSAHFIYLDLIIPPLFCEVYKLRRSLLYNLLQPTDASFLPLPSKCFSPSAPLCYVLNFPLT